LYYTLLLYVQYSQCKYSEYPGQIFSPDRMCPWNKKTCEAAARNGHLNILIWAHDNGCKWSDKTFTRAAESGHIHICKYIYHTMMLYTVITVAAAALPE
jgi:hypothetical protein